MAKVPPIDSHVAHFRQLAINTVPGERQLIGFDFGSRRIGVAVAHERAGAPRPLPPLIARDGIPDWSQLTACLLEWQPDVIIVGLPLNDDGSDSVMSQRARKFGNRLHAFYNRPVAWIDEHSSTRQAKHIAIERGRRAGSYRTHGVDGIAAEIILTRFIEEGVAPA